MTFKEKAKAILNIINLASDEEVEQLVQPEAEGEIKPEEEVKLEEVVVGEKPADAPNDMAEKIASLEDRVGKLEAALNTSKEETVAMKAENGKLKEAVVQTVQLMEQMAAEPSANPAQAPAQTYLGKQRQEATNNASKIVNIAKILNK